MRLAILVSFVAAIGAAPVSAADQPAQTQAGWQRPSLEQIEARHAAMAAKRSANVALLLGLRADQKPALDGFLQSLRGQHDGHGAGRGPNHDPAQPEGTIADLDRMSQHIDARDADAKRRIETTKRFYASLTPDQQHRFDAMAQLMHGHFDHGMGDRGGHHHGMHAMG